MGDEGRKEGLSAAVAEAMEQSTPPVLAEQLPLEVKGDLGETLPGDDQAPAVRGPGRPPGSRNKSTDQWVDYLLARYRSPLVALAEAYSRPVEELAKELGCSKLEAFTRQVMAAKELAPYVHQKQPVAVQVDSTGVVSLIIHAPGAGGQVPAGAGAKVVAGVLVDGEAETESDEISDT